VDITHSSIKKLPIYHSLGIPEIWRYDGKTMTIYQLSTERYLICEGSVTFAQLPLQITIPQLMARCSIVGEMPVLREFRQWVKEQGQE
jgi:Uma2 family endonuclease